MKKKRTPREDKSPLEYEKGKGPQANPGWANSHSKCVVNGWTEDENYAAERPRNYASQKARFAEYNPEFTDETSEGDWTKADGV